MERKEKKKLKNWWLGLVALSKNFVMCTAPGIILGIMLEGA